ncbi:MAG TPA: DUF3040 domain-containing protein [Actinoplanes sp.]|nr:DUF3040 domain-containing protein [Actinoplanes sp.]
MVTTAERRILAEIEAGLRHDDPGFVHEFTDFARRSRRSTRQREIVRAWLVTGAAVLAFAWVLQSALAIVIGLSAVSVALTWWLVPADTPDILKPAGQSGPVRGPAGAPGEPAVLGSASGIAVDRRCGKAVSHT